MNSILVAFAVILAPAGGQTPDLSKKISFERVAMPAKRMLAELSQSAGITLDTSPQTAHDVLVVRFQDISVQEALDRIALAVNGEWKDEENLKRLIRPVGNSNREVSQERQEKILELQKEIRKQVDALTKKPKAPGAGLDEDVPIPMGDFGPFGGGNLHKPIIQILSRLNPADLIGTDSKARVVFASSPTRMQKQIPGNLEPIVTEIVTAQNKAVQEHQNREKREPDTDEERRMMEWLKAFGFGQDPKPIEGRPAKLLLIAEPQAFMGGLTLKLRLYDAQGKVAIEGQTMLGTSRFMAEAAEIGKPKPAPATDDKPIELSATSKELSKLFQSFGENATRTTLSKDTEAKLLRPDLYDPLSYSVSESLLAVAKHRKTNLIALVPDGMTSFLEMFFEGTPTVNSFMQSLQTSDEVAVEEKAGWITVRPKRPADARSNRIDRLALARLVGAAKARGSVSLDELAAYALTSPSPMEESAAMQYLMLFAPSAMQMGMTGMADWNAIRLYGLLGVDQKRSLMAAGRIPFGSFTSAQRAVAETLLFGPGSDLTLQTPDAKPKTQPGFMEMIASAMGRKNSDFRQEPTEAMPNGLPNSGYLTGDIAKEPIVRAASGDPMLMFASLGADELAMFRFFKEDPNMSQMAGIMPQIDRVRVGERTNINLKLFARPDVALERTLQDSHVDPNGAIVNMNDLPATLKDLIEKRYQAFKTSGFPMFGVGNAVRPPLPN